MLTARGDEDAHAVAGSTGSSAATATATAATAAANDVAPATAGATKAGENGAGEGSMGSTTGSAAINKQTDALCGKYAESTCACEFRFAKGYLRVGRRNAPTLGSGCIENACRHGKHHRR